LAFTLAVTWLAYVVQVLASSYGNLIMSLFSCLITVILNFSFFLVHWLVVTLL